MTWQPSGISHATITGRVVADSEDKFEGAQTELRIAVGHGYSPKDGSGFKETGVTYLTYITTGDYATSSKAVGKGDLVQIVDAAISSRSYESNGEKRTALEARYGTLELLEKKGESTGGASTGGFDGAGAF